MNIVSGHIESNGATRFRSDHFELELSPEAVPSSAIGKLINLGIRSENMLIGEDGPPGEVKLIEPLGDETLIFFSCGQEDLLVAKVSADREFRPGEKIRFGLSHSGIHFFDTEAGFRLE